MSRIDASKSRLALLIGMLYFGIAPVLPIGQLRIGPITVTNLLSCITLLVLLLLPGWKRVASDRMWAVCSGVFLFSCLVGLVRAPEWARSSTIIHLFWFIVPWTILSLCPLDRRFCSRLGISWIAGMLVAGVYQFYSEYTVGFLVGENLGYSYSRYAQNYEEFELTVEMGLFTAHGYMAMSIAGVCCVALTAVRTSNLQKAVSLALGIFLLSAERRGGFVSADIVAVIGLLLILPSLLLIPTAVKGKVLVAAFTILVSVLAIIALTLGLTSTDSRFVNIAFGGLLADDSAETRFQLLSISIETWLSNPFFGIGLVGWTERSYDFIGLHSSVFDVPAQLGIFGFLGYFGFALFPMRRALVELRNRNMAFGTQAEALIVMLSTVLFLVAATLNPVFLQTNMNEILLLTAALGTTFQTTRKGQRSSIRGKTATPVLVPRRQQSDVLNNDSARLAAKLGPKFLW